MTENCDALRVQLATALTDNNRLTWALMEANDRLAAVEAQRDRAERILAALREPSEAVVRAAQQKWDGDYCHMDDAIRAAVEAAAEQEVDV